MIYINSFKERTDKEVIFLEYDFGTCSYNQHDTQIIYMQQGIREEVENVFLKLIVKRIQSH